MELEDLFYYDPSWRIVVCKQCRVVPQTNIARHIRRHHNATRAFNVAAIKRFERTFDHLPLIRDADEICRNVRPMPIAHPIRFLDVFHDGICCLLCQDDRDRYVCRGRTATEDHLKKVHNQPLRQPGRRRRGEAGGIKGLAQAGLVQTPVSCQTLFHGSRCRHFIVEAHKVHEEIEESPSGSDAGSNATKMSSAFPQPRLEDIINLQLAQQENGNSSVSTQTIDINLLSPDPRHQSQWLQVTEWPRFLEPHKQELMQVAALVSLPNLAMSYEPGSTGSPETLLCILLDSLSRIITRSRISLQNGMLNAFDQHRLNSFIAGRSSHKPLIHNLREDTYKKYSRVLQHLMCYLFRLAWLKRGPKLHYRLTEGQAVAMMDAVHTASEMSATRGDGQNPDHAEEIRKRLDDRCLILMVSLLDHKLYGDVYDSIVVSFLAVMGIRQDVTSSNAQKLSEAAEFTPKLSALIKMGQLLVAERALLAVELDEADFPAYALEEMQDRFMTKDSRSPISWSLKLRAYGKAVKDNTTSFGYIMWSDDNEILSYKKMRFSMTGLRALVSAEVEAAQNQLADLLLVPSETERKHIVPQFSLRSVMDDPSEGAPGWNFICHPQNEVLHGHRRWILDRILKEDFLRRDFFENESTGKWRLQTVGRYLSTVNAFLERLLLLVHITGGQPARGTELLCIQHSNPRDGSGGRRNIFIENGLVSFVTYYHKGYSVTGTTKIIHRYLPSDVGELLLYYVWLIVPFLSQLSQLVKIPGFKQGSTPYLWGEFSISQLLLSSWNTKVPTLPSLQGNDKEARKGKKKASRILQRSTAERAESGVSDGPWSATRLSVTLSRTFKLSFGTETNIQMWRHAAIAISRRHLQQAKFKKDFIEAVSWAWNDEMAAHSTRIAGLTYARGLEEAPGHIAGAKAEYRRISREWHAWLGFGGFRNSNI
ncbi:unnamed protein product [Fusarium langsethiae]|nr:unnamed protein product [Fusarium langsethiae]